MGCYIEGGGSGRENAVLKLDARGRVSVFVGSSALGQGVETIFAQIAADALEIPIQMIHGVFHGSTTFVAEGFGSYASRSAVMGGNAIVAAASTLRERVRELGGTLEISSTAEGTVVTAAVPVASTAIVDA